MNQTCARDLLIYLSDRLKPGASGKHPRPVKVRHLPSLPEFSDYCAADIYEAAQYLHSKKLIQLASDSSIPVGQFSNQRFSVPPRSAPSPRHFVVTAVTAAGHDYCHELRKSKFWSALQKAFPGAALERLLSVPLADLPSFLSRFLQ